jgi:3-oxoacyl-ACP reductase-like protein
VVDDYGTTKDLVIPHASAIGLGAAGPAALFFSAGVSFESKVALITGRSAGSIAMELVKYLLQGGATVVATTSSFSQTTAMFYPQSLPEARLEGVAAVRGAVQRRVDG